MLSGGMLSGAVYTEFSKSLELLLKNQNPQQTTKRKIHLFARYMKQVLMHIWKYWGTVQNPNTNTIHPGLAMWSQHLFAHKVNLHHPPLTVRGFLPQVCAQHFMSNIWREMGSPEGQDYLGKLGSCQSSALGRNSPLCLAVLQLCTHQTDPNPSKK